MTIEARIAQQLVGASMLPGSWDKRFVRDMAAKAETGTEYTEGQKEWIYRLLYKYRRQCPRTYANFKDHPYCQAKPKIKADSSAAKVSAKIPIPAKPQYIQPTLF